VTSSGTDSVSVFINNGDGTFAAKVDYTTGSAPRSVAIGDLDGDGKADLAVTNYYSTSVSVFINNASPILYAQASSGNVGIGTTSQFGSGIGVVGLANAGTVPSTNPTGGGVLYAEAGALKWRGSSGSVTTIANADYSEYMPAKDDVEWADVVSLSSEPNPNEDDKISRFLLEKSTQPHDDEAIGVISSFAGEEKPYGFYQPVSLVGRVPVKVSLENGSIEIGDHLTSSSIPGTAMRASEPGRVVGLALESFDGTTTQCESTETLNEETGETETTEECQTIESEVAKIMVFVNPHWSLGSLTGEGSLAEGDDGQETTNEGESVSADDSTEKATILDQFTLAIKKSLEKLGLFIESGIAKVKQLFAEKIRTEKLEMVDQVTGEIYCTWIENGEWVKVKGECGDSISISDSTGDTGGDTGDTGGTGDSGDTGDIGDGGDIGDTGDIGGTGDIGNTAGDTGDTVDTGDAAGDTGATDGTDDAGSDAGDAGDGTAGTASDAGDEGGDATDGDAGSGTTDAGGNVGDGGTGGDAGGTTQGGGSDSTF